MKGLVIMARKLDELEALDKIYDDILNEFDSIKSLKDFEELIKEEGIKVINSFSNDSEAEQIDIYNRLLIDSILLAIEDEAYENAYKYNKVLYEINK